MLKLCGNFMDKENIFYPLDKVLRIKMLALRERGSTEVQKPFDSIGINIKIKRFHDDVTLQTGITKYRCFLQDLLI